MTYALLIYTLYAIIFGVYQYGVNRAEGRDGEYYAEAWFVGALWLPLLFWVLGERMARKLRRA